MLAQAGGRQRATEARPAARTACFETENYAPPAGLVAADVDFGPFLLALTPHSMIAAPYHRLSAGVIAAHQAFAAPPDEAHRVLARVHATYLGDMRFTRAGRSPPAQRAASLSERSWAGAVPDWLEPMGETRGQAFRPFRVRY